MCRFDMYDRYMTFKGNFCVLFLHLILQTREEFILCMSGSCHQEKYMSYRFQTNFAKMRQELSNIIADAVAPSSWEVSLQHPFRLMTIREWMQQGSVNIVRGFLIYIIYLSLKLTWLEIVIKNKRAKSILREFQISQSFFR